MRELRQVKTCLTLPQSPTPFSLALPGVLTSVVLGPLSSKGAYTSWTWLELGSGTRDTVVVVIVSLASFRPWFLPRCFPELSQLLRLRKLKLHTFAASNISDFSSPLPISTLVVSVASTSIPTSSCQTLLHHDFERLYR